MKYFAAGFDAVVMRYYLTIGIVVLAFFANIPWLSLFCLPVFLSAILAVKFDFFNKKNEQIGRNSMATIHPSNKNAA